MDSAVHGGPRGFVESVAAIRREHARGDQLVDAPHQDLERMGLRATGAVGLARVLDAAIRCAKAVRNRPGSASAKSM